MFLPRDILKEHKQYKRKMKYDDKCCDKESDAALPFYGRNSLGWFEKNTFFFLILLTASANFGHMCSIISMENFSSIGEGL